MFVSPGFVAPLELPRAGDVIRLQEQTSDESFQLLCPVQIKEGNVTRAVANKSHKHIVAAFVFGVSPLQAGDRKCFQSSAHGEYSQRAPS